MAPASAIRPGQFEPVIQVGSRAKEVHAPILWNYDNLLAPARQIGNTAFSAARSLGSRSPITRATLQDHADLYTETVLLARTCDILADHGRRTKYNGKLTALPVVPEPLAKVIDTFGKISVNDVKYDWHMPEYLTARLLLKILARTHALKDDPDAQPADIFDPEFPTLFDGFTINSTGELEYVATEHLANYKRRILAYLTSPTDNLDTEAYAHMHILVQATLDVQKETDLAALRRLFSVYSKTLPARGQLPNAITELKQTELRKIFGNEFALAPGTVLSTPALVKAIDLAFQHMRLVNEELFFMVTLTPIAKYDGGQPVQLGECLDDKISSVAALGYIDLTISAAWNMFYSVRNLFLSAPEDNGDSVAQQLIQPSFRRT
ncbi:hypothetical protein [Fusarium cerealis partitivirus 1]|nr:hypothetical protein [Fusarium cerealis partitivirus 1]